MSRYYGPGETIAGLSRETGVNNQTLHKWKNEMVRGDDGEVDREKLAMRKKILGWTSNGLLFSINLAVTPFSTL